jgi:hypothetical protein
LAAITDPHAYALLDRDARGLAEHDVANTERFDFADLCTSGRGRRTLWPYSVSRMPSRALGASLQRLGTHPLDVALKGPRRGIAFGSHSYAIPDET